MTTTDPLVEVISTAIIENPTPTSYDEADRLAEVIAEAVRAMLTGGCDGDLPGPELTDEQRTRLTRRELAGVACVLTTLVAAAALAIVVLRLAGASPVAVFAVGYLTSAVVGLSSIGAVRSYLGSPPLEACR